MCCYELASVDVLRRAIANLGGDPGFEVVD
jgi:hypothetical protein